MNWYKVTMSLHDIAEGKLIELHGKFANALNENAPQNMALFSSLPDTEGQRQLYFPPECVLQLQALIDSYGGSACDKPEKEQLDLLAGSAEAWDLLEKTNI